MPRAKKEQLPQHQEEYSKKHVQLVGGLLAVTLVIAGAIWYFSRLQPTKVQPLSPLEQLEALDASSDPVTATPQERLQIIAEGQGKQPVMSREEQLRQLEALKTP